MQPVRITVIREETLLGAIFDVTNPMEVSAEGTPSSR
jgi:hypothetical protein